MDMNPKRMRIFPSEQSYDEDRAELIPEEIEEGEQLTKGCGFRTFLDQRSFLHSKELNYAGCVPLAH